MKVNTLAITINKSVSDVFAFTTNPANTPLWIDSVVEEVTDTPLNSARSTGTGERAETGMSMR